MKEKFIISLLSQVISYAISLFAFYLIFLNLEISLIGNWTLINSIVNLGFLFINIGLDTIHYQYSGKEDSSKYFGTYFTIKICILLLNFFICTILIIFISFTELWYSGFIIYVLFLLLSKSISFITNIFFINLKSRLKVFKAEIPSFIVISGKSFSIIFLALNLASFSNPLLYIFISNFIFDLILLIFILFISKNEYKLNKPRKNLVFLYFKDIKPLFFFSLTLVISTYLGDLILAYSFGRESLGRFSFVNNFIIQTLFVFSNSMISIYLTLFSRFFEKKDVNSIKKITYIIERYSSIIFLGFIIFVILNGRLFLSIFLPQYIETTFLINIMVFSPYLVAITRPYSYHFIAGRKQNINAYINMFTRIIIILFMIFLIPTNILIFQTLGLGAFGYALSQTLPWILWALINRYYSYKVFTINPQKNVMLHIPLAFISLLISLILKNYIFKIVVQNQILLLIITTMLSLGIFTAFLFVANELKKDDIKFFYQLIQFKTYRDSLKEELLN